MGSHKDSVDQNQLNQNRITHIVSVHDNAKKVFPDKEYLLIHVADSPSQNLAQYIPKVRNR